MQLGGSSSPKQTPIVRANYRARCAATAAAEQSISIAISDPGLPPTSSSLQLSILPPSCVPPITDQEFLRSGETLRLNQQTGTAYYGSNNPFSPAMMRAEASSPAPRGTAGGGADVGESGDGREDVVCRPPLGAASSHYGSDIGGAQFATANSLGATPKLSQRQCPYSESIGMTPAPNSSFSLGSGSSPEDTSNAELNSEQVGLMQKKKEGGFLNFFSSKK